MKTIKFTKLKKRTNFYLFLLGITLFLCKPVFSQQYKIDSLITLIRNEGSDTAKATLLNNFARLIINSDINQSKLFVNQAILILEREYPFSKTLANSYHTLGIINYFENNYLESLKHYSKALRIKLSNTDKKGVASLYNNIALVYRSQGNYRQAINNQFTALKIEESLGDSQAVGVSYNNIGIIYEMQNNFELAVRNYKSAINIGKRTNDKEGSSNACNNLGIVYKTQGLYDSALFYYERALGLRKELGYAKSILGSYNNIANLYLEKGKYDKALEFNFLALSLAKEIKNEESISWLSINISLILAKQNKIIEAKQYLQTGLKHINAIKNKQYLMESYNSLAELYTDMKDYKNALYFFKKHQNYKDSLLSDNNKQEIMRSALQYEFEKKEAIYKVEQEKKEALQKEIIQRKNIQIRLYVAISIIVILLFLGVLFRMKNARKTEKLKLEKNLIDLEQKALRLQMNPHFIFNALNAIQGFITENDLIAAKKYLTKFAKLMRLVLENSAEAFISLQNETEVLTNYLELTQLRFSNRFNFFIKMDIENDLNSIEIPPMLLQPFVENAVLHGVSSKDTKGEILISFIQKNNTLVCIIEDNGIGRQKASLQKPSSHKSTGMLVTEERLKEFGRKNNQIATLNIIDLFDKFGNPCGTKVIVEIPMQISWA